MGQSTDAILAFGQHQEWDEGCEKDIIDCLGTYLARLDGHRDELFTEGYIPYEVYKKYEEECPIEIVGHCSCDYRMYFVAIRGYNTLASRGYPHDFRDGFTSPTKDEIEKARIFCDKHDIEFNNPSWSLMSDWC